MAAEVVDVDAGHVAARHRDASVGARVGIDVDFHLDAEVYLVDALLN